ncbi:hypothetical protein [Microcoleus sp. Pol17_C1]|uniref:hypothetical protein n=1 Tax=unclassified Microcoleus TaxID=2642155 RepID=UPI002FD1A2AF
MTVVAIGGIEVQVDRDRTRATYEALRPSMYVCECAYCRNFRALGLTPFPDAVLAFFEQAGIDPLQPAETYESSATEQGKHLYGGEFYFFGEAPPKDGSVLGPSGPFDFTFTKPSPLAQDKFHVEGSVRFSFLVELPWVIADAP